MLKVGGIMKFLPSLINILKAKCIEVSLTELNDDESQADRKSICNNLYHKISENYIKIV